MAAKASKSVLACVTMTSTLQRLDRARERLARAAKPLSVGDDFDLDQRARRQRANLERRPSRKRLADLPSVNLVHLGEVAKIGEENRRLDDVREARPGRLEDRGQVA